MDKHEWTSYDFLFSSIYWCTGICGITFNIALILLILTRSPRTLKVYRIFLLNVALGDLIFSLSTTLAQIRIIPNKFAFAYITLGPIRHFGAHYGYLVYCVMLHALFYSFLSFPLSFGFRYYILKNSMPRVHKCVLICGCLWLIALAQHILFIFSETPPVEIMKALIVNKPAYNLSGYVVSGNNMITEPTTFIVLASIVLPMFPIYVLVIYFYRKIQDFLTKNHSIMKAPTIKGHRKLLKAITIQASIPLFCIFPPITIYFLYHLELINFTIIEYLVYTLFSFHPVISPLVTIYFVKPYNVCIRTVLLRSKKIIPAHSNGDKATHYTTSQAF